MELTPQHHDGTSLDQTVNEGFTARSDALGDGYRDSYNKIGFMLNTFMTVVGVAVLYSKRGQYSSMEDIISQAASVVAVGVCPYLAYTAVKALSSGKN